MHDWIIDKDTTTKVNNVVESHCVLCGCTRMQITPRGPSKREPLTHYQIGKRAWLDAKHEPPCPKEAP